MARASGDDDYKEPNSSKTLIIMDNRPPKPQKVFSIDLIMLKW